MSTPFPNLFQPLKLGHRTLKHRLTFGAHTANMSEEGLPGARHLGYYTERAKGGAAMIVVEPVPIHRTGVLTRGNFLHSDDAIIPGFRKITDACHEYGTVMIHQLYHVGQHGDYDCSFEPNWGPSGVPSYHDADGSHAMTGAEIEELIEGYGQAARRAQESGFDGIEIFAAYHSLPEQFWTTWSNRRTDEWGGSFENRMRFSAAVVERIRKYAGNDFIIGLAISMNPEVEVSLKLEEMQEIIAWHDERGLMDYVTCGTGGYFDFASLIPTFMYPDKMGPEYSEALKAVVRHARVQAESHIRTPENADYVVASGQADMVSIVRGQIADPHMANKAMDGRPEDVRPCISCNQMCWGRRYRDYWISCLVNPSTGREFEWGGDTFTPAEEPKRVLVVGGGIAGLEAARVAAERGHQVTLCEAGPQLGGQFRLAGLTPRRGQITDLIEWYETQLTKLQVQVQLNTYVEAGEIESYGADEVVVATGSLPTNEGFQRVLPHHDQLPGVDKGQVLSIEEVMSREGRPGKRVVFLDDAGGAWRALGPALHLSEQGHEVTFVTPDPMLGRELLRTSADIPIRMKFKQVGIEVLTSSAISEWHGDGATILNILDQSTTRIDADTLVLAVTNTAETTLLDALQAAGAAVHAVGDCVAPRHAPAATVEGRRTGLKL